MSTSDLTLRPTRVADAEAICELRRRDAVARNIYAFPSLRLEPVQRFLGALEADSHHFVAEVGGRVVGTASLDVRGGKERHSASVGIMVHDDFHGRGVGQALMTQLLDIADRWLGLVRVDLTVLESNAPARRLYEKLGFAIEGTQRKASFVDGVFHDVIMMARLREPPKL